MTIKIVTAEDALYDVQRQVEELELADKKREQTILRYADIENDYLVFNAAIEYETVATLCTMLRMQRRRTPRGTPYVIEFRSPGGEVTEGMRLYDELLHFQKYHGPITMRVRGEACSMGAVILQAAEHRQMGPNARLMIHRIGFGAQGQAHEVEDEVTNAHQQEERLIELFAHRTTLSAKQWMNKIKKARKDLYFNAQEALELGLVDAIE